MMPPAAVIKAAIPVRIPGRVVQKLGLSTFSVEFDGSSRDSPAMLPPIALLSRAKDLRVVMLSQGRPTIYRKNALRETGLAECTN